MSVAELPLDFENAADTLYSLLKTWTVAETKQKIKVSTAATQVASAQVVLI